MLDQSISRLAYRLLTQEPGFPTGFAAELRRGARARVLELRDVLRQIPKVCVDNVAAWYAGHDRFEWDVRHDVPNWAPPWQAFWMEWNQPRDWSIEGEKRQPSSKGQTGFFCGAADLGVVAEAERPRNAASALAAFMGYGFHCQPDPASRSAEILELARAARWFLMADLWQSVLDRPQCGMPLWMGLASGLLIDERGQGLGAPIHAGPILTLASPDEFQAFCSQLHIVGLALSFCHCKNVSQREAAIASNRRAVERHEAPVKLTYRTLNIEPMKEVLRREGCSETAGIHRALHICRGHFATYTEQAPLFGRYHGTFWVPDHLRGAEVRGKVTKNYAIQPPNGSAVR